MTPPSTPSKRRTASVSPIRWTEGAPTWHSRRWWRTPLALFLCTFVGEIALRTSIVNHPIDKEETQQNNTTKSQVPVPTDIHLKNQATANKLWADLGIRNCRFPSFSDIGKHRYDLSSNTASTLNDDGWIHPENWRKNLMVQQFDSQIDEQTHEYHQMLLRKQYSNMSSLEVTRNISFIHIGKAGGSSIGCNLAATRRYVRKHCENRQMPVPLSALSLHVNCYTHWHGHMYCYDINDSFLVNVRNPIQRMASWFLYEHVQNHGVNYQERDYHCGDLMLFSCYETFDQFTSIGLDGPQPPINQQLRIGTNLTQEECSHWAWAAALGNIPASYHNAYNYEWYANRLFLKESETEIFVIRAEHFQQDWTTIDRLLGGTASFPVSMQSRQNSATKKRLPISDSQASQRGIRNLCRAMCKEIQIYKRLLAQAVNLKTQDRITSTEELRQTCPDEADMTKRECDATS